MSVLRMEQVLKDKQTTDPNSIIYLSLTSKSLSDVSCLNRFANLERLDLAFNNLSSLEGLSSCVNLKWLSVLQNKLQSLKGIERLTKLTVLNAGKNKLKSMDEVWSLVSLRALILNDNEIGSICKLDNVKELNTLVLSRNPMREIGDALVKLKSITKLSLSNCLLETIGSSLKSCTELKELRLAHNDIKTLPAELAYNKKLQNLDLGNNVIMSWSDLKVLSSLVDLKNLNLQGNPFTNMEKLNKKVLKLLPYLHIFNARPTDKGSKRRVRAELTDNVSDINMEKNVNKKMKDKLSKEDEISVHERDDIAAEKKRKRKKGVEQDDANDLDMEGLKLKRKKANWKYLKKDFEFHESFNGKAENKPKSKKSKEGRGDLDVIDDGETPFTDLFAGNAMGIPEIGDEKAMIDGTGRDKNLMGGLVTDSVKKKKNKNRGVDYTVQLPGAVEVGIGGPSTWGDE